MQNSIQISNTSTPPEAEEPPKNSKSMAFSFTSACKLLISFAKRYSSKKANSRDAKWIPLESMWPMDVIVQPNLHCPQGLQKSRGECNMR
jgi:hypothetical protein